MPIRDKARGLARCDRMKVGALKRAETAIDSLGDPPEFCQIRRRTRVVGAFPDGQSCLNLAAARLRHIAGTAWSSKRYKNSRPLYQPKFSETGAAVA
jgi:hypothetical protein